jgi:hypothetical protein
VISTLGVVFLGQVVTWDGRRELQGFGIATALVIGALAYAIGRVTHTVAQPTSPGRNESATDAQPVANDSAHRGA